MCNTLRYKDRMEEAYSRWEFSEIRLEPKFRHKVAPSEFAPVIRVLGDDGRKARLRMMRFGFAGYKSGLQLMARGETVTEKPLFKHAFRHRRCLLAVHGFYDSVDMGPKLRKQPWHLHLKGDELMCMAALWEESPGVGSDPGEQRFTIVSCVPNSVVSRVIDRMPVILPADAWQRWLNPSCPMEELKAMLVPCPAETMEAWPVTPKLHQRGFEGPECWERIVPEQGEMEGLWG